jgi:hypothetical protein
MVDVRTFAKRVDGLMFSQQQNIGNTMSKACREYSPLQVPCIGVPRPSKIDYEKLIHVQVCELRIACMASRRWC